MRYSENKGAATFMRRKVNVLCEIDDDSEGTKIG